MSLHVCLACQLINYEFCHEQHNKLSFCLVTQMSLSSTCSNLQQDYKKVKIKSFTVDSQRIEIQYLYCFSDSLLSQPQNSWPPSASLVTEPTSSNWSFSSQQPQSSFQGMHLPNSNFLAFDNFFQLRTIMFAFHTFQTKVDSKNNLLFHRRMC